MGTATGEEVSKVTDDCHYTKENGPWPHNMSFRKTLIDLTSTLESPNYESLIQSVGGGYLHAELINE